MEGNAELVREVYRLASERDLDAGLALVDEEVELDVSAVAVDQATYRGHEGIRRYFEEVWEISETFVFDVEDAIEVDDRVAITLRIRVVGVGSGVEVTQTHGAVWRIADGKAAEIRLYAEPAEARRAVGV